MYEECSTTCGEGTVAKTRSMNMEMFGGLPCEGSPVESESCNEGDCPTGKMQQRSSKVLQQFYNKKCKLKVLLTSMFQVVMEEILAVQLPINATQMKVIVTWMEIVRQVCYAAQIIAQ